MNTNPKHYKAAQKSLICLAFLVLAQVVIAAPAKNEIYTPTAGREYQAVLTALNKPVAKFNKNKPFIFDEVTMRVSSDGWAYVDAVSVDARGLPVGPDFTNELAALLRRRHGRWSVVQWDYATDVASMEWEKEYPNVPRKLWRHRR